GPEGQDSQQEVECLLAQGGDRQGQLALRVLVQISCLLAELFPEPICELNEPASVPFRNRGVGFKEQIPGLVDPYRSIVSAFLENQFRVGQPTPRRAQVFPPARETVGETQDQRFAIRLPAGL